MHGALTLNALMHFALMLGVLMPGALTLGVLTGMDQPYIYIITYIHEK